MGETMEKKLDEKFDPVVTKLDGIMKGIEALQQENTVGAEQLRPARRPTAEAPASYRKAREGTSIILSPMLVHRCDNCKKEIKGRDKEIIAGFAWPQFCPSSLFK